MSLQFLLTAFVVCLAPGTGVIYTLAVALGQGRRAAVAAALGCTFGIVPHLLAAILGLAAVLHASALLFTAVKWAGVAYLMWLAWQSLKPAGALSVEPDRAAQPFSKIVLRGALINILNPKLSIFFLALLPPFLSGDPASASAEMLGLGLLFMVITFVTFLGYGAFAAALRTRLTAGVMRGMGRVFAACFAALGLRLALERA